MIPAIHNEAHPLRGKVVTIKGGQFDGHEYRIEDWWDRLGQGSWGDGQGNPACMEYAFRSGMEAGAKISAKEITPEEAEALSNDEVVYGHLANGLGKLIHVTQLGPVKE